MKFLLAYLVLFSFACNIPEKQNSIRVIGEGKIRVMPDRVILTINVSFTQPRMADAVRMTQQTVDSVVQILNQYGNNKTDIKTSSISANKDYEYTSGREKFIGYAAQQTIDFTLNDLSKFTEFTGRLLETKINSISNLQFAHSKSDSLLREADLLAYDDALKSANKLASRAEVKLGKLLFLSNNNTPSLDAVYYNRGDINTYNKAYGGQGFKISPDVIEFKRNITSEFEIKP